VTYEKIQQDGAKYLRALADTGKCQHPDVSFNTTSPFCRFFEWLSHSFSLRYMDEKKPLRANRKGQAAKPRYMYLRKADGIRQPCEDKSF
jgi:hypothetical protein